MHVSFNVDGLFPFDVLLNGRNNDNGEQTTELVISISDTGIPKKETEVIYKVWQ